MSDALLPVADVSSLTNPISAMSMRMGSTNNIDKAAQDFEAMFATEMLQPMFETVDVDPAFGGGHGEEVMRSFLVQEYGKTIAKTGKLGIGAQVKAEMLRAQEGGRSRPSTATPRAAQAAYAGAKSNVQSSGEPNVAY